jgi:hypothetical protein
MQSLSSCPRFGRKAKVKNGVECCEKSHMRLCDNQGTPPVLKVITGGKSVKRVLRGFATIKSFTLWMESKGGKSTVFCVN